MRPSAVDRQALARRLQVYAITDERDDLPDLLRVLAAADFLAAGAGAVLLKGGHGTAGWADERLSVDLLFEGRTVTALAAPRIATRNTHGTGCTYASAIAACLALGMPLLASVGCARAFVQQAVERATDWHMGEGDGPLDHSAPALNRACGALQAGESYLWDGGAWRQL